LGEFEAVIPLQCVNVVVPESQVIEKGIRVSWFSRSEITYPEEKFRRSLNPFSPPLRFTLRGFGRLETLSAATGEWGL
jgi:hypothetical protein